MCTENVTVNKGTGESRYVVYQQSTIYVYTETCFMVRHGEQLLLMSKEETEMCVLIIKRKNKTEGDDVTRGFFFADPIKAKVMKLKEAMR